MDHAREQFFADARLAEDQHRQIRRRNGLGLALQLQYDRALTDQLVA